MDCYQSCQSKRVLGLVETTCGLVHAIYSLPEWQAVKVTFFAPCKLLKALHQQTSRSASGLVYRLICTCPFHHASISINNWSCVHTGIVWREIAQSWFEVVHTHQTSSRSSWLRGFGELNPSPHFWILFSLRLSGLQSLLLFIHLCCSQNICSWCTKVWHITYLISGTTHSFPLL